MNSDYLAAQEGLRVSQSQAAKYSNEVNDLKNRLKDVEERLKRKTEECINFEARVNQSFNDIERFKREGKDHQ